MRLAHARFVGSVGVFLLTGWLLGATLLSGGVPGPSAQSACASLLDATQGAAAGGVVPMPPHPGLLAKVCAGQASVPLPRTGEVTADSTLAQPDQAAVLAASPRGTFNILAIMVQFKDKPAQVEVGGFDGKLFGGQAGSLGHYFRTVSYGRLDIVTVNLPSSLGWQTAPQSYSYFVNDSYGFGRYPRNSQRLTEDLVQMVDPVVDFSRYDNDHDGYVDTLFVVHAGPGAEATGNKSDMWSHAWQVSRDTVVDGVRMRNYSVEPEYWWSPGDIGIGVFAHELGHNLGLPDLYDTDYSSAGLGDWSLMATGCWGGGGQSPSFPDAWSRLALGWATVVDVEADTPGAAIAAANSSDAVYRIKPAGGSPSEYFLVENRQKTGYDSYLPAAGLLVYHVDTDVPNNTRECANASNWLCGANRYRVSLEQADGRFDLEHNTSSGDNGDPFPGNAGRRSFTFASSPNSSTYSSSGDSKFRIVNVSSPALTAYADLLVSGAEEPARPYRVYLPIVIRP